MFKNIVWDFDGTLLDTYPLLVKAYQNELKKVSIIASTSKITSLLLVSSSEVLKYYNLDDSFRKNVAIEVEKLSKDISPPFECVIEVLSYIIENGGSNYIVTNRDQSTYGFLTYYNILNYFTDIIVTDSLSLRKPKNIQFKKLLSQNKINIKKTLSIGDRALDLIPSKSVGLTTCFFNNNNKFLSIDADYTIYNYGELLKLLNKGDDISE